MMARGLFFATLLLLPCGSNAESVPGTSCGTESIQDVYARSSAIFWILNKEDYAFLDIKGNVGSGFRSSAFKPRSKAQCAELVFLDHAGDRFDPCAAWANGATLPSSAIALTSVLAEGERCPAKCTSELMQKMRQLEGRVNEVGIMPYDELELKENIKSAVSRDRKKYPLFDIHELHLSYFPCFSVKLASVDFFRNQMESPFDQKNQKGEFQEEIGARRANSGAVPSTIGVRHEHHEGLIGVSPVQPPPPIQPRRPEKQTGKFDVRR